MRSVAEAKRGEGGDPNLVIEALEELGWRYPPRSSGDRIRLLHPIRDNIRVSIGIKTVNFYRVEAHEAVESSFKKFPTPDEFHPAELRAIVTHARKIH